MTSQRYAMAAYADWAAGEAIRKPPAVCVETWIGDWRRVFDGLVSVGSMYEIVSIIGARIEFLGGLHRGTEADTGWEDFIAYCTDFLEPVQPRFASLHRLTDQPPPNGSDFFTVFRNKSLHGMTPTATAFVGNTEVIAWWVGYEPQVPESQHLLVDGQGRLNVNLKRLSNELLGSMQRFAKHLADDGGSQATRRFQRALWARYRPLYTPRADWERAGQALGLPA